MTIIRGYIAKCAILSITWTPLTSCLEPPWTPQKSGLVWGNNNSTVKVLPAHNLKPTYCYVVGEHAGPEPSLLRIHTWMVEKAKINLNGFFV
jgi:hypothetical protein